MSGQAAVWSQPPSRSVLLPLVEVIGLAVLSLLGALTTAGGHGHRITVMAYW